MTTVINLMLGTLTQHPVASQLAAAMTQHISELFAHASGNDIQLHVFDRGRLGNRTGPLSSDDMHQALEALTGIQRQGHVVSNIGILIADSFDSAPNFFGLMFDDKFRPGSSTPGYLTPREGCAVFLKGIETGRLAGQVFAEAIFTSAHELGHVFNLQHRAGLNFMFPSATGPLLPEGSKIFVPADCQLLAHCSTSRFIHPGGSRFGDLGDLAPSIEAPDNYNGKTLQMRIAISQDAFWCFDPVELDVVVENQGARSTTVPDALDPGYQGFDVWIEEPSGETRRLRPPRRYCSPRGTIRLAPGERLARDISIFGESGGYTFRRAGPHRIWVSFECVSDRALKSNVLEVLVLERKESSPFWDASAALLPRTDVAELLYYRLPTPRRMKMMERLDDFSAAHRNTKAAGMARYAMGRALAVAALRKSGNSMSVVASDAERHLKAVLRRKSFGAHRKEKAEVYLRALEQRLK